MSKTLQWHHNILHEQKEGKKEVTLQFQKKEGEKHLTAFDLKPQGYA